VRSLTRIVSPLRRPRAWAAVLACALAVALAGPQLWAAYCYRAAQRALGQNRPHEARSWLGPCLHVWPRSADVQLLAGRAARLDGDYEAARGHLGACQRLEGKGSDASVLEWALLRAENGELKGVESFLRARAERDPDQAAPIFEALATGYLRLYRVYDAMGCLEWWLRLAPDDARALYLRGRAWERVGAYAKAAADYEAAVGADPGHDEARLRLANAYLEDRDPRRALPHLELLRGRRPDDPEVLIRLAFAWNALGRLPESLALIDEVLERHPDNPTALSARGQLALEAERPAEAEGFLRRALAANPYDRRGLYALCQCLGQQGKREEAEAAKRRLKEAEETLDRLLTVSNQLMPRAPHDPALHYELGTLLVKMGHEDLGLGWYYSALEQDPAYRPAHEALADHFARAGDGERAAYHRRQAARQPPAG
jgi:tetratricopeptide (TPR) repeat protein